MNMNWPSLIDWSAARLDTTPCDDGDMDYLDEEGKSKESKAQAKEDVIMVNSITTEKGGHPAMVTQLQ